MLVDCDLERDVMKEITQKMVSATARLQQVTYAMARSLSEWRACALMSVARSALNTNRRRPCGTRPLWQQ
jgi:putative transposase